VFRNDDPWGGAAAVAHAKHRTSKTTARIAAASQSQPLMLTGASRDYR